MFLLPLNDEPNPRTIPIVTYSLIVINILIYFLVTLPAQGVAADPHNPDFEALMRTLEQSAEIPWGWGGRTITAYDLITFRYGFHASKPSIIALFTSLFLHASIMHLLGNMLFLYIFGNNVEHCLKGAKYLFLYLIAGALGSLLYAVVQSQTLQALIGASGAISGVLGYYFVCFPNHRVNILFWFFIFIRIIPVPARWVLGLYFVIDNLIPFLWGSPGSNVAYGAHVGGFLCGAAWAGLFPQAQKDLFTPAFSGSTEKARVIDAKFVTPPNVSAEPLTTAAVKGDLLLPFLQQRQFELGLQQFMRWASLQRASLETVTDDSLLQLADGLVALQRHQGAYTVLTWFLARRANSPSLAVATLRLGLLERYNRGRIVSARQHFTTVLSLPCSPEIRAAAEKELATLKAGQ